MRSLLAGTARTETSRRPAPSHGLISRVEYLENNGLKSGSSVHRYLGGVVDGRVFVRSWTLKPGGWYRAFLEDPLGARQCGVADGSRTQGLHVRKPRNGERARRRDQERYVPWHEFSHGRLTGRINRRMIRAWRTGNQSFIVPKMAVYRLSAAVAEGSREEQ